MRSASGSSALPPPEEGAGGAVVDKVTVAEAMTDGSATEIALTVTVAGFGTAAGGV